MKIPLSYIVILFLAALLLISLQECSRRGTLADANLNALTDTVTHFKNRLGTETASKATLQLSNKQLQKYVIDKDAELQQLAKEFARVNHVVKAKAELRIDSVLIPYAVPAPCDFERTGTIKDKWYSFGYASNQNGLIIDSLKMPISVTAITGVKRKWFLGKETLKTDITFDNPHLQVTDITAAEVVNAQPWYKKWYVWAAVGFAGGVIISR